MVYITILLCCYNKATPMPKSLLVHGAQTPKASHGERTENGCERESRFYMDRQRERGREGRGRG